MASHRQCRRVAGRILFVQHRSTPLPRPIRVGNGAGMVGLSRQPPAGGNQRHCAARRRQAAACDRRATTQDGTFVDFDQPAQSNQPSATYP